MRKIVADWKLNDGKRFSEMVVYVYNYNAEEVIKYGVNDGKPFKDTYKLQKVVG